MSNLVLPRFRSRRHVKSIFGNFVAANLFILERELSRISPKRFGDKFQQKTTWERDDNSSDIVQARHATARLWFNLHWHGILLFAFLQCCVVFLPQIICPWSVGLWTLYSLKMLSFSKWILNLISATRMATRKGQLFYPKLGMLSITRLLCRLE